MLNRPIARVSIALLILFLCHCGGNTNIKPSNGKPTPTVSTAKADAKLDANTALRINKLLAQAQQQTSPTRENLLLQAAELYLEQGELDKANNLVSKMVPAKLPDTTFVTYSYIAGLINLNNSEADAARRILTNGRLER
jgi:outer membrane PBP1 activator LpoA protein